MFAQFGSLAQFFDYFKDDDTCLQYWISVRWNGNISCPHCGSENPYVTNRGYKCRNVGCQKKFSALSGSIFENTKVGLRTWFAAIYLCTAHKKGISSLQLSRDLGIHQKSAWYMLHRIREAFKAEAPEPMGGEGTIVEVDETYIGGKLKNMHNSKRREMKEKKRGISDNKTVVMGYLERGDNIVRFRVLPRQYMIKDQVRENVDSSSVLMTDSATTYTIIGREYAHHEIVDHSRKEYVRDKVLHTNTIEGAFSLLDRMITGIYHYVSPKHMQSYLNENAYRYNTRKATIPVRFEDAIQKFEGKRLLYKKLTA